MTDPYATLGVPRTASAADIKKAYRRLAKKHHPDVNAGNKRAEEKFKDISAAFEIVGDPKKRALWDEFGEASTRSGFDEQRTRAYMGAQGPDSGSGFEGSFGGSGGAPFAGRGFDPTSVEELFGDMFSRRRGAQSRRRWPAQPERGHDFEGGITIGLREAVLGSEQELLVDGRSLKVKVPPGVTTGSKIRLAGQGSPGERGGPHGDLLLTITVRDHPEVHVHGRDLELELPVTVLEALEGGEVTAPTFEGPVKLKIPAGSQSGRKLRLRGRGLPALSAPTSPRGDLYVVLRVALPVASAAAREAALALDKLYAGDVRAGLVI